MHGEIKISIQSDFEDYYDNAFYKGNNPIGVYRRNKSDLIVIPKGLSFLRGMGINTVRVRPVRELRPKSGKVIVYTGASYGKHSKVVMDYRNASMLYPSIPASEFIENTDGVITKILQIGKRRFKILINNEGNVEHIVELGKVSEQLVRLPIYSIDYISTDKGLVATAFNNIEDLSKFSRIMAPYEVVREIYEAMIRYNMLIGS